MLLPIILLIASASACIPAQTISPSSPPAAVTPTSTFPSSLTASPTPSPTQAARPLSTLRPQATCTQCILETQTVQRTATASLAPILTWVVKQEKLDVWDDPANENSYWHRQTQLITGEAVLALAQSPDGEWTQIIAVDQPSQKDERGYPGWVRTSGLAQVPHLAAKQAVVIVRSAFILSQPSPDSSRLMRLYFDTRLLVVSSNESWIEGLLPDGREGWLKRGEVRLLPDDNQPVTDTQLIAAAQTQAGAPYLWGGTTADSPDCSGFTYRLFHAYGVTLPRDADDQALAGQPVTFDQKKPGDLVFYSDVAGGPVTHVGLYVGNDLLMDANPWLGLSPHPLGDMQKWYVFHSVRRIFP